MTNADIQNRLTVAISGIQTGQFEAASKLVNELEELYKHSSDNDKESVEAIRIQSVIELVRTALDYNEYALALQYLLPILQQTDSIFSIELKGLVQETAARVYSLLGDYPTSFDLSVAALQNLEEAKLFDRVSSINNQIGILYYNLGNFSLALQYMEQALEIIEKLTNPKLSIIIIGNMANANLQLKNFDKAELLYREALRRSKLNGLEKNTAFLTGNLGALYLYKRQYERAMEYYQDALKTYTELDDKLGCANVMGNIGRLYAGEQYSGCDMVLGEKYILEAFSICEQLGDKRHGYELAMELSDIYEGQKRWQESLEYYKKYDRLKSDIASEESIRKAQLLENKRKVDEAERDRQVKLARFQEQEKILYNILPAQIAERILDGEKQIADTCEQVSVFFCDIVGFTKLSERISAQEVVNILNEIFTEFDHIAKEHGLEKIKTIGDAYMAVAGVPVADTNHALHTALFAINVMKYMDGYKSKTGQALEIRIGLHCGHAVAGVIGESKFAYDLWGDAVNTASRMESHGLPGKIQVSEDFKNALNATDFHFEERGELEVKGKGVMKTYFLTEI